MAETSADPPVMPHLIEAEKAVLGAILVRPEALYDVLDLLQVKDFWRDAHQRIYQSFIHMSEAGVAIDFLTLREHLAQAGDLEEVGGPAYIAGLIDGLPPTANVAAHARIVREKAIRREALYVAQRLLMDAHNETNLRTALAEAECQLGQVVQHAMTSDDGPQQRAAAAALLSGAKRIRASHIIEEPAPVQIIEGIVWQGCDTFLVAESAAGKSFVFASMAAAVDAGVPWFGRRTRQGSVVLVLYEQDAVNVRLRAIRDVQGYRLEHTHVILASEPLSPRVSREGGELSSRGELVLAEHLRELRDELQAKNLPPVRLVVIDTVRASMTGSEDQSEYVSAYLRAGRRLRAVVPTASLAYAHHSGWQDGQDARKRERGSSAWRGNVDATLYLEAGEYNRETGEAPLTLLTKKARDGEPLPPLYLIRRRVVVPGLFNEYGEPVTTCVIEADRRTRETREADGIRTATIAATEFDLKVLRVIVDRPDLATSQERIRVALNVRKALVTESVARLVGQDWARSGKRGEPYSVTEEGRKALLSPHDLNRSQQFPTVPRNGSRDRFPVPTLREPEPGTAAKPLEPFPLDAEDDDARI